MSLTINPIAVVAWEEVLQTYAVDASSAAPLSPQFSLPHLVDTHALRLRAHPAPRRMTMSAPIHAASLLRTVVGGMFLLLSLHSNSSVAQSPMTVPAIRSNSSTKPLNTSSNPAESSLDAYLLRVRSDNKSVQASPGAIWTDAGRLTRMSTDVRAMRPHDLISVVVSESLAASTDGTVKNSRASNATSGISGLIGTLHAANALQNLINQNSTAGLSAQGTSATNSSLTTTFGGQVVEVLPNGMLVIEAARQVEFSQQTQTIVLRGLVRPEDISQQNQVLSTAISSMELQVRGKGIVNDYTRRQNPLVRLIERLLVF